MTVRYVESDFSVSLTGEFRVFGFNKLLIIIKANLMKIVFIFLKISWM